MSWVHVRRCDCCLCLQTPADPRDPWYQCEVPIEDAPDVPRMLVDVCGGCRVKPLLTIHIEVRDNIDKGRLKGPLTHETHQRR